MEKEILESIKASYQGRKNIQNEAMSIQTELAELEKDEQVKRYLALKEISERPTYEQALSWTENEMLDEAIALQERKIKNTNGIYLYLGTYFDGESRKTWNISFKVDRNDPRAKYSTYIDIEKQMRDVIQVPITERENFEQTHHVLLPSTVLTEEYYHVVRRAFIKEAMTTSQEDAVQKILKIN